MDELLVVVVEGFIGWRRTFEVVVVCWNDSNGSNVFDGGGTDGVIVGQIEGWVLK